MMNVKGVSAAIVVGLSVSGWSPSALSLGLGRPTSRAILGEAFTVSVPVRMVAGEEIADDCVAADVYFGDDKLSQAAVAVSLLPGSGLDRTIRVSTTALVNEPVVTLYLAVGCHARITRKFVAFADPPGLPMVPDRDIETTEAEQPSAPAAAPVARPRTPPRPASRGQAAAPVMAPASAPSPASTPAPAARVEAQPSGTTRPGVPAAGPVAVKPRPAATTARAAAAKPSESSRLELDPADVDAMISPSLSMSASLSGLSSTPDAPEVMQRRSAAAALWAAMNASPEQLARDRERLQMLEQRLARLQQDSSGAQAKVAGMARRVDEAESERLRHPVVYALVALCLALTAALAWLARRQRRLSEEHAAWWQGDASADGVETAPAAMAEPMLDRTAAEFMPVRAGAEEQGNPAAAEPVPVPAPAPTVAPTTPPVVARPVTPAPARAPAATAARPVSIKPEVHEAAREITVEELIDLEQQAEFFVVLGQDEAAIELLESHVQSTAGASPLPYLKLLEIYQRRGQRDDYERIRLAFNGRFNAYAPSWEADLQHGHSLEDYPGVVERLQALWPVPARAMEVLEASLTRADGSQETFDLPAYRELLFLYAVARDRSERESTERSPVDLLLPVHDVAQSSDLHSPVLEPLMATRPVKAVPEASPPSLSLDLSLDDPVPEQGREADTGGVAHHDGSIDFGPIDKKPGRQ